MLKFKRNRTLQLIGYYFFMILWKYLSKRYSFNRRERIKNGIKPRLVWTSEPLLNFKYWSISLVEDYHSKTIMKNFYNNSKKEDFDLYIDELDLRFPYFNSDLLAYYFREYLFIEYLCTNFDIIHTTVNFLFLESINLKKIYIKILKDFGCKIITIPYGSDYKIYSNILDTTRRHTHLYHYPLAGKNSKEIESKLLNSIQNSDVFLPGSQMEGIPYWDVLVFNPLCIDLNKWTNKEKSYKNKSAKFVITHSPNHGYIKGSPFIKTAIESLNKNGYDVEYKLITGLKNEKVLEILKNESDLHIENLHNGYGLNAIEAMSLGLPVISNITENPELKVFRRYCYLDECPVYSSNPETIENDIELFLKSEKLRTVLGKAGRKYVEKYHSTETVKYLFNNIYEKIWFNDKHKIIDLFDPFNPNSYNNQSPKIEHPLVENKIPAELMKTLITE